MTFVVSDKEFALHKAILSTRSDVFAAMFDNDLKEKKENKVTIEDISVETFEELLQFIYCGTTANLKEFATDLLVVADKVCTKINC